MQFKKGVGSDFHRFFLNMLVFSMSPYPNFNLPNLASNMVYCGLKFLMKIIKTWSLVSTHLANCPFEFWSLNGYHTSNLKKQWANLFFRTTRNQFFSKHKEFHRSPQILWGVLEISKMVHRFSSGFCIHEPFCQ